MSLSCRQQRLLRGIDAAVCRSDPRLASMLGVFGQLTAGEEMPGREQLRTPALSRIRAVLVAAAGRARPHSRARRAAGPVAVMIHVRRRTTMHVPLRHNVRSQAVPANGAGTEQVTPGATPWQGMLGKPAQLAAMAGMLAGLWVAISPWLLTLQAPRGGNAAVNDLIIGLAVAALGLLTMTGARSVEGLQAASLLAGVWLIISPFILDAKVSITAAMYWSNIWSGAIIIAAALAVLAFSGPRAAD